VEQLIVILIFVAIAVANQLLKKSREGDDTDLGDADEKIIRPPRVNRPAMRPQETDEERMRRFMEALGVPPTSAPPRQIKSPAQSVQPVQPYRPPTRPVRAEKSSLSPVIQSRKPVSSIPPVLERPVVEQAGETRPEPETAFPEAALPVTVAAVGETPADVPVTLKAEAVPSNLPLNIRSMLRNRDSIRAAMILREVIDSPRGLQSYR